MTLIEFLKSLSLDEREQFAADCETTVGHIRNVAYGCRTCSPELALMIETNSRRKVSRKICPTWQKIWPDFEKETA